MNFENIEFDVGTCMLNFANLMDGANFSFMWNFQYNILLTMNNKIVTVPPL